MCEFTHAHIQHYSFLIDVNLIVYIRGGDTAWQHRKPDHLTEIRSASLQRSWGVFCCTDLLQLCCLVCLNKMSSVKDMIAEVDFYKWGQSAAFHQHHPSCSSHCGILVLFKGGQTSWSHKKITTKPTKNLPQAKGCSHDNKDNHSQWLTWTWNTSALSKPDPQRSVGISKVFGLFVFLRWYNFHWTRKKYQRNLQHIECPHSLRTNIPERCQDTSTSLHTFCRIKCQVFHHMNTCEAGLGAPNWD